jgi:glutaredoxin 3
MITIYSKNHCPQCQQAKQLLDSHDVAYTEIKCDEQSAAREFMLSEGHRSVPQIYRNGQLLVPGGLQGLQTQSLEFFQSLKG